MNIAISGASGLIGRRLAQALTERGHAVRVWSRRSNAHIPPGVTLAVWDPVQGEPPADSLNGVDAVIHLAGERVAQRWTADARKRIRDSRVLGTRNLIRALGKLKRRPATLICASASGYYGNRGDEVLTEASPPGSGFLADLCVEWEQEAMAASFLGIRVVRLRIGVVLDPGGGALAKMLPPFRWGVGGKLGNGRQWMSWIHVEDLIGMVLQALEAGESYAWNAVSPKPCTNAEFTQALARTLHRPAIFPVPPLALRLVFGRMAEVVLASQRILPRAAEDAGYTFQYPEIGPALAAVLGSDGRSV